LLQLALNAASIGCAGFSALTPYRPLFRALTVTSLAALARRQGLTDRRTLATAAAALALAASSDVLAAANRGPGLASAPSSSSSSSALLPLQLPPLVAAPLRRALSPLLPPGHYVRALLDAACGAITPSSSPFSSCSSLAAPPLPSPPLAKGESRRVVSLRLKGVRCEACAARVKGALAAVPGVREARVDVETGEAVVYYYDQIDEDGREENGGRRGGGAVGRLVAAVERLDAGYEAEPVEATTAAAD
jgi:copper chaperone CopZ